jgi:hypothetical protein
VIELTLNWYLPGHISIEPYYFLFSRDFKESFLHNGAELTPYEPPSPPLLIVTSDYDTPNINEWQTVCAQKIGLDACVDVVTRYEDEHEDQTQYPEVQPDFLYDFGQPR